MTREERIKIFEDTNKRTKEYPLAKRNIQLFVENSILPKTSAATKVSVVEGTTFQVASKYKDKKVCVLNFASATNPGGGVKKGSSAQEECLCRESSLYESLNIAMLWENYYKYHRERHDALYTNRIIFVPNVLVIKNSQGELLENPWECSCITCAAPNLREKPSNSMNPNAGKKVNITEKELLKLLTERYRRIIALAEFNKVEVLVLGAIGCGAFQNKPQIVARAFKDAMKENGSTLQEIVFGIYDNTPQKDNYNVFNRLLGSK